MAQTSGRDGEHLDGLLRSLFGIARTVARPGDGLGFDKAALIVLISLGRLGPSRPSACAQALSLDQSTISRHLRALQDAGYVVRTADPQDGRASLCRLTDTGRGVLADLHAGHRALLGGALAGWSGADRRALATLLDRLAGDLGATAHWPPQPDPQPATGPARSTAESTAKARPHTHRDTDQETE